MHNRIAPLIRTLSIKPLSYPDGRASYSVIHACQLDYSDSTRNTLIKRAGRRKLILISKVRPLQETSTKSIAAWKVDIDLGTPTSRVIGSELIEFNASAKRICSGLAGPLLLGIGSGISISAGFGSFGFSVLLDGLRQLFHTPLWLSQVIMTVLFFIIAWHWGRIRLGAGTLPAILLVGPAISLGASVPPEHLSIAWHGVAFLSGLFMFSFGISLSAAAALGPDGVTALSLAAEKRWKWPVARANFIWNLSAIAFGVLCGGNIGPATIVGLVVTPMIIRYFLPRLRRRLVS